MKIKKIVQDVLTIFLISIALVTIVEITLRVITPESTHTTKKPDYESLAFTFHEDYLVSLKPNIEKTYIRNKQNGSDKIKWKTNSDAFRGNALKKNPKVRIMVYGDSSIHARFSTLENTFCFKLEQNLNNSGVVGVETINAGIIGFGPDQSLIRFEKEIDKYKPDIVIFHILAENDFGDIIKNRLFELDQSDNLVKTGHKKTRDQTLKKIPTLRKFYYSLFIVKKAGKLANRLKKPKEDTSTGKAEKAIQRYLSLCEKEYAVYKQTMPRKFSHFGDHYDMDMVLYPDAESSRIKVKLMDRVLSRAKKTAESKGTDFIVLILPSVIDLTKNFFISYEDLQKYPVYRPEHLTKAVESICRSNQIKFVNLYDVFRKNDPENLFFNGRNNHWNDAGQDIAAEVMTSYITSNIMSGGSTK